MFRLKIFDVFILLTVGIDDVVGAEAQLIDVSDVKAGE